MGAVRIGLGLVSVNTNNHQRVGAKLVGKCRRAKTDRAGNRHHDVGTFVIQVLGEGAAIIKALEIAGEQAFLRHRVPAKNLNVGSLLAVVVGDAVIIAVHEGGHRRDVDAAKGADDAGFRHACRQIAGKEARLVGGVDLTDDIRNGRVIGEINDRIFLVRIGFCRGGGRIAHQEADGYDNVALAFHQRVQVRLIVRLRL